MSSPALVLFDVDGTLVDSNYLHTLAWSRALHASGEWAPMCAIHRLIGMGSDSLLDSLIGRHDDTIAEAWRASYEILMDEVRPFPDAALLLGDLANAGVHVALATSAPMAHVDRLVDLLRLNGTIDFATSADDVTQAKPDPEIFLTAMHRAGGDPRSTFVVGDSTWDIYAATAAGLPCIAVETGGYGEAELRQAGAVAVHRDVAALRSNLRASPLGALLP